MTVWAVSDMHRQLPQIHDCACSGGSPIDSPSLLSQSPTRSQRTRRFGRSAPYERFAPRAPARVRYRLGDQAVAGGESDGTSARRWR